MDQIVLFGGDRFCLHIGLLCSVVVNECRLDRFTTDYGDSLRRRNGHGSRKANQVETCLADGEA